MFARGSVCFSTFMSVLYSPAARSLVSASRTLFPVLFRPAGDLWDYMLMQRMLRIPLADPLSRNVAGGRSFCD